MPKLVSDDPWLTPYAGHIDWRRQRMRETEHRLTGGGQSLVDFASGHTYFGLHRTADGWVCREWAPHASALQLFGNFSHWEKRPAYAFQPLKDGLWELCLPANALKHEDLYRLHAQWPGGTGERLPTYARRVVQDPATLVFNAQVWAPDQPYEWKHPEFRRTPEPPLIYETHVGMAQDAEKVGSFNEFRERILPRIIQVGYNTLQFMAIQEHPYYGSFGYHVTNFFAASSRFGTPEDLKTLIDAAHEAGLAVIMDIIHSHSARNEIEGLSRFDGTEYQFFHKGGRGMHDLWDSRCFDYGKPQVLHFLLSNCRFWLDEYHFDGFRFDGITSMMYYHHGMSKAFTAYDDYFGSEVDEDAVTYLTLANSLIHTMRPDAMTIAEDVSGMPGLGAPLENGGIGFDYRLAMGIPDNWIKLIKEKSDEQWNMTQLWRELTNRRADEKTVSYAESHDQALVGDQTLIFRLIERDMYDHMSVTTRNLTVDRGLALHKMIRLVTLATAGQAYLNFMGNEWGHPEWIDFPRQGNGWSYKYARRQWHLRDDPNLTYRFLAEFDQAMIELAKVGRWLADPWPRLRVEHCDDQILGFERHQFLFLFNFNPTQSFTDYAVETTPGAYRLLLDTDAAWYGGYSRLATNQLYSTGRESDAEHARAIIRVYLPCRSALVLHRLP